MTRLMQARQLWVPVLLGSVFAAHAAGQEPNLAAYTAEQAEQAATDLEIERSSRLTAAQRKTLLELLQKVYL